MDFNDIDALNQLQESKYSICIALAKRSRELGLYLAAKKKMERVNVVPPLIEGEFQDPMELAIKEVKEGKVSFTSQKIEK